MREYPDIFFTGKPSGNVIAFSTRQFVNLIKKKGYPLLLSGYEPQRKNEDFFLYLLKDGFILNSSTNELQYLENFFEIKNKGFSDFFEFLEFLFYEADIKLEDWERAVGFKRKSNPEIFKDYKNSAFFGYPKENFETFIDASKKRFTDTKEYNHAIQLGIENKKEYDEFTESGYRNYSDLLKAKEGNFKDKKDFYDAKSLEIQTFEEYIEFINKGFKKHLKKIEEIKTDAKNVYEDRHYEEHVRINYLLAEKIAKLLYYKIFDKEISRENDLNISEILTSIQEKLNIKLDLLDDLNKWRLRRNEIVHDHIKVEREEADSAKEFFEIFTQKLMELFFEYRPK